MQQAVGFPHQREEAAQLGSKVVDILPKIREAGRKDFVTQAGNPVLDPLALPLEELLCPGVGPLFQSAEPHRGVGMQQAARAVPFPRGEGAREP